MSSTPSNDERSDNRAAMVFFFGGGWNSGSPNQFYPHCSYLASRGMVCMAAEYRVKDRNNTSPREAVMDGKSAIRWVRLHASELGIDPERIAAGGGSAGGNVAAAAGTTRGFDEEDEELGDEESLTGKLDQNGMNGPESTGIEFSNAHVPGSPYQPVPTMVKTNSGEKVDTMNFETGI